MKCRNLTEEAQHSGGVVDARKLSELLYLNKLNPVYHGEHGIRTLKELARSYITMTRDLTRVMSRLKAIYRSWGIACAGQQVYAPRCRAEWLAKISEAGVRRRVELYYQQFDALAALRQSVRRELLAEGRKHLNTKLLRKIPWTKENFTPRGSSLGFRQMSYETKIWSPEHGDSRNWSEV